MTASIFQGFHAASSAFMDTPSQQQQQQQQQQDYLSHLRAFGEPQGLHHQQPIYKQPCELMPSEYQAPMQTPPRQNSLTTAYPSTTFDNHLASILSSFRADSPATSLEVGQSLGDVGGYFPSLPQQQQQQQHHSHTRSPSPNVPDFQPLPSPPGLSILHHHNSHQQQQPYHQQQSIQLIAPPPAPVSTTFLASPMPSLPGESQSATGTPTMSLMEHSEMVYMRASSEPLLPPSTHALAFSPPSFNASLSTIAPFILSSNASSALYPQPQSVQPIQHQQQQHQQHQPPQQQEMVTLVPSQHHLATPAMTPPSSRATTPMPSSSSNTNPGNDMVMTASPLLDVTSNNDRLFHNTARALSSQIVTNSTLAFPSSSSSSSTTPNPTPTKSKSTSKRLQKASSPLPTSTSSPSQPQQTLMTTLLLQFPHACDFPGCGRTFNRAHNLRSHRLSHIPKQPLSCHECGLKFQRKHDLLRHVRTRHSIEKPFECPICGMKFSRADSLKKHVENETRKRAGLVAPSSSTSSSVMSGGGGSGGSSAASSRESSQEWQSGAF
ncbi:hypothetical protein HDU97_002842 [Phlyctochytrium planicorne]|nr:hypothetical protein HDU97_002842 [Phlyctochytrium planicorne]